MRGTSASSVGSPKSCHHGPRSSVSAGAALIQPGGVSLKAAEVGASGARFGGTWPQPASTQARDRTIHARAFVGCASAHRAAVEGHDGALKRTLRTSIGILDVAQQSLVRAAAAQLV